jgi:transcriptional regulator with XRE-family HTH domain
VNPREGSAPAGSDPATNLGAKLRQARLDAHMTVRELARQLGVSASHVSQLEHGKSQPSVATLYSLAQFLGVSIDRLFQDENHAAPPAAGTSVSRRQLGSPAMASDDRIPDRARLSVTMPDHRTRLLMDHGVVWEQLVRRTDQLDFMEIRYPPGSSSKANGRMLRHDDYEYGVLLEGELEVTIGFDVFSVSAGDAIGFDSSIPHLFRNPGTTPARGIWVVHHRHD